VKAFRFLAVLAIILTQNVLLLGQSQPNVENGFKPYGSYDGSNLDRVNMLNSNLILQASMYPDVPQRGGKLGPKEMLYATGANWVKGCSGSGSANRCYWTLLGGGVAFQQTWGITVNRSLNIDSTSGQTVYTANVTGIVTSDGATHHVYGIPGSANAQGVTTQFESIDGTGLHVLLSNVDPQTGLLTTALVSDRQGTLYLSGLNGAQCSNHPSSPFIGAGGYSAMIDNFPVDTGITCTQRSAMAQITDSNGNTVIFPPVNSGGTGTDTMGRPTDAWGVAAGGQSDSSGCSTVAPFSQAWFLSYAGPYAANNPLKLCYSTINFATGFNLFGVAENQGSTTLVTTVINSDGGTWNFTYDNSYLSITSMTVPTGGSIQYQWTNFDPSGSGWYERVLRTRTVTDNNGHSYQWQYHWGSLQGTSVGSTLTNMVNEPQGNDTVHVFTDLVPGNDGFFETSTLSYQGLQASGTLLKRVDTTYGTATKIAGHAANVFPTSIQTTVYPSGKVNLVTKQYDTGLGTGAPIFGNVMVEKDYDWGVGAAGALLREIDTTYLWQVNSGYLTAHLIDLPATVIVKDGAGCALAETDYTYDEPQYLTSANITTNHGPSPAGLRGNLTTVTKWLRSSRFLQSQGRDSHHQPYQLV